MPYSCRLRHRLGCHAVGENASDHIGVAVLLVSGDLAFPEVDHEGIVVVVALAVAREIPAPGLDDDDIAAVDHTAGHRGALDQDAVQRAEDLVDDGLLADEFTAPRAFANGSPHDVVVTRFPEGGAIAFGNLLEEGRDEL